MLFGQPLGTYAILLKARAGIGAGSRAGTGGSDQCGWGNQPSPPLHMGIQSWKTLTKPLLAFNLIEKM